jgi:glycosyltransferase involved in cell wall biosynthesis
MKKIALLTNIVSPYRVPIYREISKHYDLRVFTSGQEDNRDWGHVDLSNLSVKQSWGFSIHRKIIDRSGNVTNLRFVHINFGYIIDLVFMRPDAVISLEMGFRSLVSLAYCTAFRKPLWIWWGGTPHSERSIDGVRALIRRWIFARSSNRWISYGNEATLYLESIGVPSRHIVQIQNSVSSRTFTPIGDEASLDCPHPRILFVGQLIGRKGLPNLLRSLSMMPLDQCCFSIVVVGTGPERESYERLCAELGLSSHVVWVGSVSAEDMPAIYRACDLLVFPTLEDVWGQAVNESLLCGTPVLSSVYAGATSELLPVEQSFDPVKAGELCNMILNILRHGMPPADSSRVWDSEKVSRVILEDLKSTLEGHPNRRSRLARKLLNPRGVSHESSSDS